ncbi:MAG: hypothetical protein ONA90_07535, partial [candidate division KSB1 bacterium]|nr:hypothetical protein [candidate division KSB1 bacterium]
MSKKKPKPMIKKSGSANKKPRREENPQPWSRPAKTLAFWAIILLASIWVTMNLSQGERQERKVTYSKFKELLADRQIKRIEIKGAELHAELKAPQRLDPADQAHYSRFQVNLPEKPTFEIVEQWEKDYDFPISIKDDSQDWWNYLLSLLPWLVLGFFWIFLLRRMQGVGTKGIFSFGKSRAKMLTENRPKVTFDDVAGADEAKQELREIIDFLRDPEKFQRLGGK